MADDFQELYTSLLGYAHRGGESEIAAKREVNLAQLWLNRRYQFKYAEKLIRIIYPANGGSVKLATGCSVKILGIISAQITSGATSIFGPPLDIIEYSQLIANRLNFSNREEAPTEDYDISETTQKNHERYISSTFEYLIFLLSDAFGLYPTPTADVDLLLQVSELLPPLVEDTDKNFLTVYCKDVIITKALHRFSMYLKEDIRNKPTREQLIEDYESAINWDSSIRHSNTISIS